MTFLWPQSLYGLALLPLLVALYVLAQGRRRTYAVRFTNLALLGAVVGRGPGIRRHVPPLCYALSLAALLVGLARPVAVMAVPRDQASVVLVLDVSGSMVADDLRPSRLEAAERAAAALVAALPERAQVGVVTFNGTAAVRAPLTRDRATVGRAMSGLVADGGTAIGDGLHLALDQLARRPPVEPGKPAPAAVILLSDGFATAGRPPLEAAARAREEGVKVFTVGIGRRGAAPEIPGGQAALDEPTLQTIAAATGGDYYYAAEAGELQRIYAGLGSQVSWVEEATEVTALAAALGALLLLLGGFLSVLWLHRLP